jgi:hypothetical protein
MAFYNADDYSPSERAKFEIERLEKIRESDKEKKIKDELDKRFTIEEIRKYLKKWTGLDKAYCYLDDEKVGIKSTCRGEINES